MKLSEHIIWAVKNCEETNPTQIQKHLIDEHGIEVSIEEIKSIQEDN